MSARRCRDLWFGSELLSTLAKAAAKAIQEEIGATNENPLIFPNAQSLKDGSVANKIVVRFSIESDPVEPDKNADRRTFACTP